MKQDWTKQLADRMADYRRQAPEGLLDSVKEAMSERGYSVGKPTERRARVVPMWAWRAAGVAAVVAVMALVGTSLLRNGKAPEYAQKGGKPSSEVAVMPSGTTAEGSEQAEEPSSVIGKITAIISGGRQKADEPLLAMAQKGESADAATAPSKEEEASKEDEEVPALRENEVQEYHARATGKPRNRSYSQENTYSSHAHRGGGGFNVGAFYSGGASIKATDGNMYDAGYASDAVMSNVMTPVSTISEENHHHQSPVKVGVQVRYNISRRWSVQTGIDYAYLSSDFSSYDSKGRKETSQKLHFVGIPVNASYNIITSKHFTLYLTAGGEAQKMVSGKAKTTSMGVAKGTERTTEDVKMSQLQLSTNAAIGAEYKITDRLSVYAEPGATYYFDNSSSVESYYSEDPLKFSVNVGVRFNINN